MADSTPSRRGPTALHLILDELCGEAFLTRTELIDRTGLSRSTVSGAVSDLLWARLLTEHTAGPDPHHRRPGRPVAGLSLTSRAGLIAAIDYGHTHLSVAVANLALRVLTEHTIAYDVAGHLDAALRLAEQELAAALARVKGSRVLCAVGMGVPAPILAADQSVVSGQILPGWGGTRPAAEFGKRLGLPAAIDNDANLGALAEVHLGAARGARDVLYLKVSSGIGAGLILAGRQHRGAHGMAGELGHIQVSGSWEARPVCRCGGNRCLESLASTTAIFKTLEPSFGELDLPRLTELAAVDPGVRRVLTDAGRALGCVIADLTNTLNPGVVVLGGVLSGVAEPVLEGLRESLDRRCQPAAGEVVTLVAGELGERASSMGALLQAAALAEPVAS